MGVDPKRTTGMSWRPLTQRDIEVAQMHTKSAAGAARYLNVSYATYRKYARIYGIFEKHINQGGSGVRRTHLRGSYGLDEILAGKHPQYDKTKLKVRLIAAGYLEESCAYCGFDKRRPVDGKVPLILQCKDGDNANLALDNLHVLCYNCTAITTGTISSRETVGTQTTDGDLFATQQLTVEDIERMQDELMGE